MMAKGIRVDLDKKKELQEKAVKEWYELQSKLDYVVGGHLNVSSTKWVPHLLYNELGLPKKTRKDKKSGKQKLRGDEAALRDTMAFCKHKIDTLLREGSKTKYYEGYIICHYILKIRGLRKQISSYLGMHIEKGELAGQAPFEDPDGRIRGTISVGGTETARFSHSKTLWDTGINLATVPRKLRVMFIPDDGYEMAEIDLNRGESWVYAHLSEDPELLRIHHGGFDFHSETAAAISVAFGEPLELDWIIENKNGKAYKIRYVGKKTNHASSYRMGPYLGAQSINEEAEETGVTVTKAQFKAAQEAWHAKYFMIESNWWPEIEQQLEETKTLITPYGRIHTFHDHWGSHLLNAATAYVPQSTSVDYINRGFLRVYHKFVKRGAWGLSVLAQSHDSLLIQYKQEHRDEVLNEVSKELTSTLVIKDREFSIPVEAGYGQSWGDQEEFKLAS